jgi:FixJ family two-component response regulator
MQETAARATVAVVDDEPAVREAIASLIRSAEFAVECYASAEDFIAAAGAERAACLVLDVRLPGMSGLGLQRHLASLHASIPIVFLTACEDGEGRLLRQAFDAGASAFLRKPCASFDLLRAVRSVMRTYTKAQ